MSALLYVPLSDEAAPAGGDLPLPTIDGAVPAFTSLTRLQRFRPGGGRYLRVDAAALADAGFPVVLDPGTLFLGEPREEPAELLDAVRAFAAARDDVRAAYRAVAVRPPDEPEPVIGLELEPGTDERAAVEAAAHAVGPSNTSFLPLPGADEVSTFLLERTQPFWIREDAR